MSGQKRTAGALRCPEPELGVPAKVTPEYQVLIAPPRTSTSATVDGTRGREMFSASEPTLSQTMDGISGQDQP